MTSGSVGLTRSHIREELSQRPCGLSVETLASFFSAVPLLVPFPSTDWETDSRPRRTLLFLRVSHVKRTRSSTKPEPR